MKVYQKWKVGKISTEEAQDKQECHFIVSVLSCGGLFAYAFALEKPCIQHMRYRKIRVEMILYRMLVKKQDSTLF